MESERLARARRVQSLREMTKLSRRQFGKKTGIAHSTMQHWEDGKEHALPEKSVPRLLKALANLGVHCSYDWLMNGTGNSPQYIDKLAVKIKSSGIKISEPSINELKQKKQMQAELEIFLKQNTDAIEFLVPDDAMEPCYVANEIVAGIRYYGKNIEKLIGLDCIVLILGGETHLRTLRKGSLEGYYHLSHINHNTKVNKPFFYDVELVSAAPVVWIRRKFPKV